MGKFCRDISDPLEIIANLLYLAVHDTSSTEQTRLYIGQ